MVCDMPVTDNATERDTLATPRVVLREEVFDRLTAERGATNDTARAQLLGINRATILRLRQRKFQPSMTVTSKMTATLGCSVEDLFEHVAA